MKFVFSFSNENANPEKTKDDVSTLDQMIKRMSSKDSMTSDEQELLKTVKSMKVNTEKMLVKIE